MWPDHCVAGTHYCVRFMVLDAPRGGFQVRLSLAACRGVELTQGDVARAVDEMRAAGCTVVEGLPVLGWRRGPPDRGRAKRRG